MANKSRKTNQSSKTSATAAGSGKRGTKSSGGSSQRRDAGRLRDQKMEYGRLKKLLVRSVLDHQATREAHGIDGDNPKVPIGGGGGGGHAAALFEPDPDNGRVPIGNAHLKNLLVKSMLAHQATREALGIDDDKALPFDLKPFLKKPDAP